MISIYRYRDIHYFFKYMKQQSLVIESGNLRDFTRGADTKVLTMPRELI